MAKPILVANWKNHPDSIGEAKDLLQKLSKKSGEFKKLSVFIAPPYTYFESVSKGAYSFSHLASQDLSLAEKTMTGEVSAEILQSFGVKMAIVGHSERRALGEGDETVAKKVKLAIRKGIIPLVCVGESVHDKEGEHLEFIRKQIRESLAALSKKDAAKIVIAYEPIWAIGKKGKDAMRPDDLSQMVLFIRKVLSDMFGRESAMKIKILYGGSVEPSNAQGLMKTGANGYLVGHASLRAGEFLEIARALI
jgi:triosephosphate isomerase (TIM)